MHLIEGPVLYTAITEIIAKAGKNTENGAHSLFLGQVRSDHTEGKQVRAIEFSAFEEMVIGEADKINKTILSEFGDVKSIEILHSKGIVRAGEISLFVMVSAGHSEQAQKACAKAVEMIRDKLPIWRKEIFEDDTSGG
jgi:molybdopterin synthase catalytic subunit